MQTCRGKHRVHFQKLHKQHHYLKFMACFYLKLRNHFALKNLLTKQFAVAIVNGKIPQGSGHCSDHAIIAMSQ